MKRLALFLALFLVGAPSVLLAQVSDTLPPVLDASQSGFAPAAIDVTTGPAAVTVSLFVTDDLSGVTFTGQNSPGLVFRSPSGAQSQRTSTFQFINGDALAGMWQGDVTFPQGAESGTWYVESIVLEDNVGNFVTLDPSVLTDLGFPTTLEVTSNADTTPPTLVSFSIDKPVLDTSAGADVVTVTMQLTDADTGVDFSPLQNYFTTLGFFSPVGNFIRGCSTPTLVAGTPQDGTWTSSCYFPQYSQAGAWSVYVFAIHDVAGNVLTLAASDLQAAGFPGSFDLTSTPSDVTVPQISALSFSPTFIDTSTAPQTVTATANVTDDISGFSGIQMSFRSPSGGQRRTLYLFNHVSGTPLDGTIDGSVDFPQFSEAGTWQVESLFYYDDVFNYVSIGTADISARGFPTVLNVVLASLVGDGPIGVGGGTVMDSVFGDRAQVTLPPGAVAGPTDVAIDVLASPLTFPMPTGFSSPGTRFVNISFTPVPAMPFAAPGATIVLPLVDPMPAGTLLALYRVDPALGSLVLDVSVGGGPVFGTVDPSGLSATFTGVSHLSVVVGLIPDNQPPVVTPPASITIAATEALGTRGAVSPALASFLAGGTATDDQTPSPIRLAPQVAGADVDNSTLFGLGITLVNFRFQDVAGNIGTAAATVTVARGQITTSGPIQVCDGTGLGITTLTWTSPAGVTQVQVRLDSPSGKLFSSIGPSFSKSTGPQAYMWEGRVVYLQDVSGGLPLTSANTLATVTAHTTTAGCGRTGTLTAEPPPLPVCDGTGQGTATLTWTSSPLVTATEVHVGSPTGPVFSARLGRQAPVVKATGKWVSDGMTFYLQDVSGGLPLTSANTLATVAVPVTTAPCP